MWLRITELPATDLAAQLQLLDLPSLLTYLQLLLMLVIQIIQLIEEIRGRLLDLILQFEIAMLENLLRCRAIDQIIRVGKVKALKEIQS